jgi:hypothetical protein
VNPGQVDRWLNEAYRDIVARLRLGRKESSYTLDVNGETTISDVVEVYRVWVDNKRADLVDRATFNHYSLRQLPVDEQLPIDKMLCFLETTPGTAAVTLRTYPKAAGKTAIVDHALHATLMVDDSSTPDFLIDYPTLIPKVINYARAYAKWQEGETAEGDRYMMLYEEGLPKYTGAYLRDAVERPTVFVEKGYFD